MRAYSQGTDTKPGWILSGERKSTKGGLGAIAHQTSTYFAGSPTPSPSLLLLFTIAATERMTGSYGEPIFHWVERREGGRAWCMDPI